MIINLKRYRERGWLYSFKLSAVGLFYQLLGKGVKPKLGDETEQMPKPRLKSDDQGNSLCVSCKLCEKICPTKAIEVIVPTNIHMPKNLKEGPAPQNFAISDELCVRCSLCVNICPVSALASGEF